MTLRLITCSIFIAILCSGHAQETLFETLLHDGQNREYIVYVPASYDSTTATPLMLNFHGYTQQANGYLNSTRMKLVADTAGFILVAPQGLLFLGNTHWNVGAWTEGSRTIDLGFTERLIDQLVSDYHIDEDRVYSCGFSNGGYFSFELACNLSNSIAAIGSVGGKMSAQTFNACDPQRPVPVVTIHGTQDDIVSYVGTQPAGSKTVRQVNDYWKETNNTDLTAIFENIPNTNTTDGSTVEYYFYQNGDQCTAVDHYKVIAGGHDWHGSWGNRDIDASSVIWNFVSQYDINGLIGCLTTATDDLSEQFIDINVYPNPTNSLITIEMDYVNETACSIYRMDGQLVKTEIMSASNNVLSIRDLPPNIYFLKILGKTIRVVKLEE